MNVNFKIIELNINKMGSGWRGGEVGGLRTAGSSLAGLELACRNAFIMISNG